MKQKTRLKFWKYRLSVHEWPIYRHGPQKTHIGRSLVLKGSNLIVKNKVRRKLSFHIPIQALEGRMQSSKGVTRQYLLRRRVNFS